MLVLAAGAAASATRAAAQSPPLTGEDFLCGSVTARCVGGGSLILSGFDCDPGSISAFGYQAAGTIDALQAPDSPYPGTYVESGVVTSAILDPFHPFPDPAVGGRGSIGSFTADFAIFSSAAVVVGRKRLLESPLPGGDYVCFGDSLLQVTANLCYVARLPDGSFDRGTSSVFLAQDPLGPPFPRFFFGESFTSDPSVGTCGLLPETSSDCKQQAWAEFRFFRNQGDCVAWVETEGSNVPNG